MESMMHPLARLFQTVVISLTLLPCSTIPAVPAEMIPGAAASLEMGRPLITHYGPRTYQGHPQQWAVAQAADGRIYSATGDNILEFDGDRWRRIVISPNLTVRSMASSPDGRIYIGAQGEVGFLEPDHHGRMAYHSLSDALADHIEGLSDVWRTHVTSDGVYFSTFDAIIRHSSSGTQTWRHDDGFHFAHAVGDRIFVVVPGSGLKELQPDRLQAVPGGDVLAQARVYAMEALPDGEGILIATGSGGFFHWKDEAFSRWETKADGYLSEAFLYHAAVLSDGRVLAGTVSDGVFLFDSEGRWLSHVNRDVGLPVNEVNFIFEDAHGGVWLAQDLGLSRLEWHHPITVFDDRNGPSGTILATHRHDGRLLTATTQGLFYLSPGPIPQWHPVAGIQTEVWGIESVDERLFAASHRGVYEVHFDRAELIHELSHPPTSLLTSQVYPGRLYVFTRSGELLAIQEDRGEWTVIGSFEGLPGATQRSIFSAEGDIWLGSEHAGVIRIAMDEAEFPDGIQVDLFGRNDGLSSLEDVFPAVIDGDIHVRAIGGLHRFDPEQGRFAIPAEFADLFGQRPVRPTLPHRDSQGRLWMHWQDGERGESGFGYAQADPAGNYLWHPVDAFSSLENAYIHHLRADDDGVFWFSSVDLFRYDSNQDAARPATFSVLIRDVLDAEGISRLDGMEPDKERVLAYDENRIRFELAVPRFDRGANLEYQTMLAGLDQDWSSWTRDPLTEYANLWEGAYEFRVRARDQYGNVSEVSSFGFSVIPPWYRSPWAWLAYVIALGATGWGSVRWRFRRLEAQNRRLERRVQVRTRQLEEAMVTDPLTRLRNRRYLEKFINTELSDVQRRHRNWLAEDASAKKPPPHVFFMVDIDHFKQVNDHHGHGAGDRVLEQFGEILRTTFRESDYLVRWGGEEFLAIARRLPEDQVQSLAERLRLAVDSHDFCIGQEEPLKLSCSIGFAEYPPLSRVPDALDWLKLVDLADYCLYAAKKSHRNAWVGIRLDDTRIAEAELKALRDELPKLIAHSGTTVLTSLDDSAVLQWT
jgi:diguanylate cyclase (GGDEF)-like protein